MCTETSLDLRHFYPTDLEIAEICQTDHEIQIKISHTLRIVYVQNAGPFQPIVMEPMKEKSRIFRSLEKLHGF